MRSEYGVHPSHCYLGLNNRFPRRRKQSKWLLKWITKVKRINVDLTSMEKEKKVELFQRSKNSIKRNLKHYKKDLDKQLHSGGITQLSTVEERSKLPSLMCVSHVCHVMCL